MARRPIIFAIDPDPVVRTTFERSLEEEIYEIVVFEHGKEALEKALDVRPDLVFLDLDTRDLNSVEVLRKFTQIDVSIRIYIMTIFEEHYMERLRKARREGLNFQVAAKPVSELEIRAIAVSSLG